MSDLIDKTAALKIAQDIGYLDHPDSIAYAVSDAIAALPPDPKVQKLVEALREAVYLLDPDEEDIAKETGLYRIVTTLAEIEGNPCPRRFISMEGRE